MKNNWKKTKKTERIMDKTAKMMLTRLYKMSYDIFGIVQGKVKIGQDIAKSEEKEWTEEDAKRTLTETFMMNQKVIEKCCEEIGMKAVRDTNSYFAIGSYLICLNFIKRNGMVVEKIPIIYEPLEYYFKKIGSGNIGKVNVNGEEIEMTLWDKVVMDLKTVIIAKEDESIENVTKEEIKEGIKND